MFYDELIPTYLCKPNNRFFIDTVDESWQTQKIMTNSLPATFNLSCLRSSVFEGADVTSGKAPCSSSDLIGQNTIDFTHYIIFLFYSKPAIYKATVYKPLLQKSIFLIFRPSKTRFKTSLFPLVSFALTFSEIRFAENPFCISTYNEAFHWIHVCSQNRHRYINLS